MMNGGGGKRSPNTRPAGTRQYQQQQQSASGQHHQQRPPRRESRQNSQQGAVCRLSPPRSERVGRKSYGRRGSGEHGGGGGRRGSAESGGGGGRRGSSESQQSRQGQQSGQWLDSLMLQPPHRSQSFRHRPRPNALLLGGRGGAANQQNEMDSTPERRRSTPTIHRRASLSRGAATAARVEPRIIDVWPRAKPMSEAEERFLQLPDFADFMRVRQFNIDAKGAVIHRGDSFRRKRVSPALQTNGHSAAEQQQQQFEEEAAAARSQSNSARASISSSIGEQASMLLMMNGLGQQQQYPPVITDADGPCCNTYKICVLGQAGSGKSALISQFVSSSSSTDVDDDLPQLGGQSQPDGADGTTADCCVSVNIGGHECELQFTEWDLPEQWEQFHQMGGGPHQCHACLLVYSIDRKASFRVALRSLEQLRAAGCPAPLLLVANKADLERKRTVGEAEVKAAMLTYDVPHFEVSVALNHDVDDLLVGIVAQLKESFRMNVSDQKEGGGINKKTRGSTVSRGSKDSEDFHAAIRRFSQRKKRQMGVAEVDGVEAGKCMNLFEKLRKWRRGTSNC